MSYEQPLWHLFAIFFGILQKKNNHTSLKKYCMMNEDLVFHFCVNNPLRRRLLIIE